MRLEVTYAKLQGANNFIPGIGKLGESLPPMMSSLKTEMWIDSSVHPGLLFLTVNGKEGAVPLANIQNIVFAANKK